MLRTTGAGNLAVAIVGAGIAVGIVGKRVRASHPGAFPISDVLRPENTVGESICTVCRHVRVDYFRLAIHL